MKRIGFIWEKIYALDNIKAAIWFSSEKKRNHEFVMPVLEDIEAHAKEVQRLLASKTYVPSPYIIKEIRDNSSGKIRVIHNPRYFPDQVIHWALMLQIQQILMRGMYEYSCGSVPGRGPHYGRKHLRKWLDTDFRNTKYCFKLDIEKFYPSIDNEALKQSFRRSIKDPHALWLIDTIIDSAQGLPIGNYTSQWFANFALEPLDHMIKERLRVPYYMRYVDDLVLLGPNKKKLHRTRFAIEDELNKLGLRIKDNWQVFLVNSRAIDFLGYRFYRNRTTLRRRNALRIKRRFAKIGKKGYLTLKDASAVVSYWGWMKHSDSYNFYNKHCKPIVSVGRAKGVISKHAKIRNLRERQAEDSSPGGAGRKAN